MLQNTLKKLLENSEDSIIKTLYITDLDGTLLNDKAELSNKSCTILQSLIDNGLDFIIATGRTRDNALAVVSKLKLKLPIISDNGTFIYDSNNKVFLQKHFLNIDDITAIVDTAVENDVMPFINSLDQNNIHVFYSKLYNEAIESYYKGRIEFGNSIYILDPQYIKYKQEAVFNISMLDTYDKLSNMYETYKLQQSVKITFFPSHYYPGYWWLEVLPRRSGKGQAINFVKKIYNPKKIVCFGDNLNDLCMFEQADNKVAPTNAVDEIKDIADEIIDHCDNDSVAKYIQQNFK